MIKKFKFDIIYFTSTGKYYTDTTIEKDVTCLPRHSESSAINPYMTEVVNWLKTVRDSKIESLPGLSSKGWDGHIFVNCEEGYPCLIPCQTQ